MALRIATRYNAKGGARVALSSVFLHEARSGSQLAKLRGLCISDAYYACSSPNIVYSIAGKYASASHHEARYINDV